VRVHVGDGRDADALTDAARRRGVIALHVRVVMMMVAMMMMLLPSLVPMLWRYRQAVPQDRQKSRGVDWILR
jgi:predicted metal-binding membrane protein